MLASADQISSLKSVLFVVPSMVGAGVERRVSILVNHWGVNDYTVKLGLLRKEGDFLAHIPASILHFVSAPRWLETFLYPLTSFVNVYNFVLAVYQINQLIKRLRPTIIVTFTLETTLPMYLVCLVYGKSDTRWIISEDSNTSRATNQFFTVKILERFVLSILGRVYRYADAVTCVSNAVKKAVRDQYRVPLNRLSTVHNPVDAIEVQKKASLAVKIDYDYILAVGRLVKLKQFDVLIESFVKVNPQRKLKLMILGEGPERCRIENLIESCGLTGSVLLPGFDANPWRYMAHARMLVLTSKSEGFGNVVAEAMTVGCPVIATACGGPEDIIRHHENGVLVKPDSSLIASEITRLLEFSSQRESMIQQGRRDALQYRPEIICEQFVQVLDNLVVLSVKAV